MSIIPTPEKQRDVSLYIAVISVFLAFGIHLIGDQLAQLYKQVMQNNLPEWMGWFLELSSPIFIFRILSEILEHELWKWTPLQYLLHINTPNICGQWKAELRSSFDEYKTVYCGDVTINQSWSKVSVSLKTEKSHSSSEIAALVLDGIGETWLVYEYLNEPWMDAVATMHPHRGTCRLTVKEGLIEGDYYTGRDRNTNGKLKLMREGN